MELIFYLLVFVAGFLALEGLGILYGGSASKRKARTRLRLQKIAARLNAPDAQQASVLRSQTKLPLLDKLYRLVPGRRSLELTLYRAGLAMPPARFVGLSILVGAGGVVAAALFSPVPALSPGFALLGVLPSLIAARRASQRMHQFEEQFPEALELMTRALRAGHSLSVSFQLISEELPDPIGPEFGALAEEMKLGQELRVALGNLAYRVGAGDMPYFVTAVLVQRETGGNLAELLDNLGYVIRDRFKLFAKVRALTSVGKMTANILGLWPPFMVLLLSLSGAGFIELLWTSRQGKFLSLSAFMLVVVGYVLCRRAAQIRV